MKRKLAMIVAATLCITSLIGCGSVSEADTTAETQSDDPVQQEVTSQDDAVSTDDAEEKTLSFIWWGNQTRNERTQEILSMYSTEHPEITFDPQFAEWGDYWQKLATASAGHELPDIVQMDYSYLKQYVSNDLLVDLTPYIEDGTIDVSNVDEGILNSSKVDGGIYAICNGVNVPAHLYNKTLLTENGIEVKDNMTVDDFVAISKEIYEKTGYKTNIAYGTDAYIDYFARAYGETVYEDDKIGASESTLKDFYGLYETGITEGWLIDPSVFSEVTVGSVEQDPMVYGSSPATMSWCFFAYSNQLSAVQKAAPEGMEIGITTWPSKDPVKSDFLKPSQFFAVTVDSEYPEEAAKVIDYITNSVECNNVLLGERGIPVSSVVAEAIGENMTENDRNIINFINDVVAPNSSTISPPAPTAAAEAYNLNDELVEKVCYGLITAEEAASQFYTEGNAIMAAK